MTKKHLGVGVRHLPEGMVLATELGIQIRGELKGDDRGPVARGDMTTQPRKASLTSTKRTRDERDYCMAVKVIRRMTLAFLEDDLPIDETGSNAPLVITTSMAGYEVKRLFVDQGSSTEIMFWDRLD
jgi:hypothetical protein